MVLEVQKFLQENSLAVLRGYGIKHHSGEDNVFSLNYDQLGSVPSIMVNQCRGLILIAREPLTIDSKVGETVVLARPMDRFFNMGEPAAPPYNFNKNDQFFEKLDGTMCLVWHDSIVTKKWQVGTRSSPYANIPMDGWLEKLTFSQLFKQTLMSMMSVSNDLETTFQDWANEHLSNENTYIFELVGPANRVVVRYAQPAIHLLAVRNRNDGKELSIQNLDLGPVRPCPVYKFSSFDKLLKFVNSKEPSEQEGIVILASNGQRWKVKNSAYLAAARQKDSLGKSPRAILELILEDKLDDAMPLLDATVQQKALDLQLRLKTVIANQEVAYSSAISSVQSEAEAKKALAVYCKEQNLWLAPIMDRFAGKSSSFQDWLLKKKSKNGLPPSVLDQLLALMQSNC